jgi:hypothetical protein
MSEAIGQLIDRLLAAATAANLKAQGAPDRASKLHHMARCEGLLEAVAIVKAERKQVMEDAGRREAA